MGGAPNQVSAGFGMYVDEALNVYATEVIENVVKKFSPSAETDVQYLATTAGKYEAGGSAADACNDISPAFYVYDAPQKPARIYGPTYVDANQGRLIYYVDHVQGNNYTWTVPPDAQIVRGQGYRGIQVKWGESYGQVSVTVSNVCGTANPKIKNVQLNQAPVAHNNHNVLLLPNPVVDNAILKIKTDKAENFSFTITLANGVVMLEQKGNLQQGDNAITLKIAHLQRGNYFIHIKTASVDRQVSFVKE